MEDDQWNYPPKRGSNERPRPGGGNSGPLSGQRPGASRPANATGPASNGRQMGNPNASGYGSSPLNNSRESRPIPRSASGGLPPSQGGWRGPSGPLNTTPGGPSRSGSSYTSGDTGRRSGGLGGQDQRGRTNGGWEDGQTWQGQGNTRTSRNLTPPTGRPALGGGRGQSGQWNNNPRGWDNEEDEWDSRPSRSPSGKQLAGGRAQPPLRKGTAVRGDWVVETDPKYKAPSSSLRVRLLLLLLAAVIALGAGVYFVPGAKNRLLAFLPGSHNPSGASGGNLTLQVDAPSAKVTLNGKTYTTSAGQTAPFSSVSIPSLTAGNHNISIQAANFTDFTGQLQMPTGDASMTVWLAPAAAELTTLSAQFKPATQPDPGVAGDAYSTTDTTNLANGTINISVSYVLGGLSATSFSGQIVQGTDTKTIPLKPATLTLIPDIIFTNAAGTKLGEYQPQALSTAQFALQMPLALDNKGALQFGTPSVVLPSNVTANFTGPAKNDYALYYAIAAVLPNSTAKLSFSCLGAVDNQNFNPEDGLQIAEAGGAHYFYRWGLLWATNTTAQTLTPNAPVAQGNSNEFNDANTAHANGSCGS